MGYDLRRQSMIGKTLAHYVVTEQLGSGGMGEVYRATDGKLGRDVAIKVLPEAFARDPDRVARFEREAKLLAALNHPNVASIYGFEKANSTHFLVLELVEGETLAERLSRGPVPPVEALQLTRQIVDALEAAHEKGVIHRDLKPANIKITPEGKVKVLDFGLAKAFASEQSSTQLSQSPTLSLAATNAGVILGTAAYMSPEQAKGSLKIDSRTDIFSLGCVLYEMFTGRQTFHGDSVPEVLASVLARDADLTRLPANLNPRLYELIRRCLEKDPRKRWHAVGDVRVELDAIASDVRGIEVVPQSATRLARRKVAGLLLAGIAVGFLIAGAFAWSLRPEPNTDITRYRFVLPEGQTFSRNRSQVSAISPDGSMLAYVANRQLYLKKMSELEASPIRGTDLDVSSPFFSPDGQSIAFYSFQDSALRKIAVTGGAPLTLCPASTLAYGMHWVGNTIVFGQGGREIVAIPADTGGKSEVWIKAEEGETISSPQLLPGDDLLMFSVTKTGSWDKANIVVQSRKTGKRTTLISGGSGARYIPTGHIVYALGNTLLAAPFDLDQVKPGTPTPIVEDVSRSAVNLGPANFDFSQNGTFTYVSGLNNTFEEARVLAIANREGKTTVIPGLRPGPYLNPRVSPDGQHIAVEITDNGSIAIYDLSGKSQVRRLTLEGVNYAPIWSPDSKQVAFRSMRDGKLGIFTQNADGTGIAQRLTTAGPNLYEYPFSWHGDTILYAPGGGNDPGMSSLSITDRKTMEFAKGPATIQLNGSFSSDGRWVAYSSNEASRRFQIFVKQFPTGLPKYQVTNVNSEAPVWSPKTNELFYFDVEARQLKAVRIQFTPSFSVSEPIAIPIDQMIQPLNTTRQYDVMPDGQRFVVMKLVSPPTGGRSQQIHVVLNWFEELRHQVPIR